MGLPAGKLSFRPTAPPKWLQWDTGNALIIISFFACGPTVLLSHWKFKTLFAAANDR